MERIIEIAGKPLTFRATALTVSKYRDIFQIDLLSELHMLSVAAKEDEAGAALWCMGMAERLAYAMVVQDKEASLGFEEWVESFPILALREALPEIQKLWLDSMDTTSEVKKKQEKRPA